MPRLQLTPKRSDHDYPGKWQCWKRALACNQQPSGDKHVFWVVYRQLGDTSRNGILCALINPPYRCGKIIDI